MDQLSSTTFTFFDRWSVLLSSSLWEPQLSRLLCYITIIFTIDKDACQLALRSFLWWYYTRPLFIPPWLKHHQQQQQLPAIPWSNIWTGSTLHEKTINPSESWACVQSSTQGTMTRWSYHSSPKTWSPYNHPSTLKEVCWNIIILVKDFSRRKRSGKPFQKVPLPWLIGVPSGEASSDILYYLMMMNCLFRSSIVLRFAACKNNNGRPHRNSITRKDNTFIRPSS